MSVKPSCKLFPSVCLGQKYKWRGKHYEVYGNSLLSCRYQFSISYQVVTENNGSRKYELLFHSQCITVECYCMTVYLINHVFKKCHSILSLLVPCFRWGGWLHGVVDRRECIDHSGDSRSCCLQFLSEMLGPPTKKDVWFSSANICKQGNTCLGRAEVLCRE